MWEKILDQWTQTCVRNTEKHLHYNAMCLPILFYFSGRSTVSGFCAGHRPARPHPMSGFRAGRTALWGPYVRILGSKRSGINTKNRPICPDSDSGISYNFPGSYGRASATREHSISDHRHGAGSCAPSREVVSVASHKVRKSLPGQSWRDVNKAELVQPIGRPVRTNQRLRDARCWS